MPDIRHSLATVRTIIRKEHDQTFGVNAVSHPKLWIKGCLGQFVLDEFNLPTN
jgi:hypothetical protein